MVWESWFLKRELTRTASGLRRRKGQRRWREESFLQVQWDIFLAAYVIRKLIEAETKLSDEVESHEVPCKLFPLALPLEKKRKKRECRRHIFEKNTYNFDLGSPGSVPLRSFCNLLIHSTTFFLELSEVGSLKGLYVTTDQQMEFLYYFDIDDIVTALELVASDDIVEIRYKKKEDGCIEIKKSSKVYQEGP
jgi:hypothetical protein